MFRKKIETAHHLVHIGFNTIDEPEVTDNIKKHIDEVSGNIHDVLVFVQEPMENLHRMADTFNMCLHSMRNDLRILKGEPCVFSLGLGSGTTDPWSKEATKHPPEITNVLSKEFDAYFTQIREIGSQNGNEVLLWDIYKSMEPSILPLLTKLWKAYQHNNIYNQKSQNNETIDPQNSLRYKEVMGHAYQRMGSDRIFFTQMDSHMDRDWKPKFSLWNTKHAILEDTYNNLKKQWCQKTRIEFVESYASQGREITEQTKHIVGGENWGECVRAYEIMLLQVFGYQKENVSTERKICCIPAGD